MHKQMFCMLHAIKNAIYMQGYSNTVQLTAKFTLASAIHTCVVQFYLSELSELACHMHVRLLMLH